MIRRCRDARPKPGHCRRAYFLTELLGALPLIVVASTLSTMGAAAILGMQKRAAEVVTEYHGINSRLDALRRDTRSAVAARALATEDGTDLFELQTPDGRIRYRLSGDQVTRDATGDADRPDVPACWRIPNATVRANPQPDGLQTGGSVPDAVESAFSVLTVHIRWHGRSRNEVDPARRFDADFFIGRGYRR